MSSVHYFQRYSQKENVVTNNTLLLFSRLYNSSPSRFEDFLNSFLSGDGIELNIGVSFSQQTKAARGSSIPDGALTQPSFKVLIETKLYDNQDHHQLKNHLLGFEEGQETQVLLLINPSKVSDEFNDKMRSEVTEFNKDKGMKVRYIATTFDEIIKSFESVLFEYDIELNELLEDYREYCLDSDLLPRDELMMRAIVSRESFTENMKHGIYFAPANRNFSPHRYVGLYRDKAVRGIGVLKSVVYADFDKANNAFTKVEIIDGVPLSESDKESLLAIMQDAESIYGWDVYTEHQFIFVEKFYPTNYQKISKYPLQNTKFFDLGDVLNVDELPCCEEIAEQLKNETWT